MDDVWDDQGIVQDVRQQFTARRMSVPKGVAREGAQESDSMHWFCSSAVTMLAPNCF